MNTIGDVNFKDAPIAFDKAIAQGRLSADKNASNYAGEYMYMGTHSCITHAPCAVLGKDMFKHIGTRAYLR